jgi:hypothetical protein
MQEQTLQGSLEPSIVGQNATQRAYGDQTTHPNADRRRLGEERADRSDSFTAIRRGTIVRLAAGVRGDMVGPRSSGTTEDGKPFSRHLVQIGRHRLGFW